MGFIHPLSRCRMARFLGQAASIAESRPSPASLLESGNHDTLSTMTAVPVSDDMRAPVSSGTRAPRLLPPPTLAEAEAAIGLALPEEVSEDGPEEPPEALPASLSNQLESSVEEEVDQDRACTPSNIFYDGDEPAPPPMAENRPDEPVPSEQLSALLGRNGILDQSGITVWRILFLINLQCLFRFVQEAVKCMTM